MKKEKKIKTELDHLKSIDSSLLTIALLLMGIIAIVAIATIGIYSNVDITANAAAENSIKLADFTSGKNGFNTSRVGLESGKTYKIKGYYGGASVDSSEGATPFEATATAVTSDETIQVSCIQAKFEIPFSFDELNTTNIRVRIFDGIYTNLDTFEISPDDTSAFMIVDSGAPDGYLSMLDNFVIESITEYGAGENSSEDLSAGTIVENITGSFTTFLTGTGDGIVNFFDTIFTKEDGGISVLGIVALSMMGLGIATGVIKYLLSKAS